MNPCEFFNNYFELHPLPDDERVYEYDIDTIAAGQVPTVIYTVEAGFSLYLQEIWIDTPPNSAFEIYVKGQKFTTDNQLDFKDKPLKLRSGEQVIYKIFNNDAAQQTFENKITGFGRRTG